MLGARLVWWHEIRTSRLRVLSLGRICGQNVTLRTRDERICKSKFAFEPEMNCLFL